MPKATRTDTTRPDTVVSARRDFLAFTAGAAATKTLLPLVAKAAPALHPDAELIELCERFNVLERQLLALYSGPGAIRDDDEREELLAAIQELQQPILQMMMKLRATTLDGLFARVRCALLEDLELKPQEMAASKYVDKSMLGAIIRDLAEHPLARSA